MRKENVQQEQHDVFVVYADANDKSKSQINRYHCFYKPFLFSATFILHSSLNDDFFRELFHKR